MSLCNVPKLREYGQALVAKYSLFVFVVCSAQSVLRSRCRTWSKSYTFSLVSR